MAYLAVTVLAFAHPLTPRLFWTVGLPLLPVAIVLMGFYRWRAICPLAAIGRLGALRSGAHRRVPGWLEARFFLVTFGVLWAALVLRLVATNGDGVWLGALLVGLALAAVLVNALFTGKTWCNFVCPVGLVERIYTEPASLAPVSPTSQCARCTACKKNCPDIDQENAYWKDVESDPRRVATYAFPGLVLGFYLYYWLRAGDWAAYFDGAWTERAADAALAFGPGFFFAPSVPALAAAALSLLLCSAASYALFALAERLLAPLWGQGPDAAQRRRHHMLAAAAFAAFSIFYVFAGAPSLSRIDGGTRAMAFVAPVIATAFLWRRWGQTRVGYLQKRTTAKLLKRWRFDAPPPDTPAGVVAFVEAHAQARELQLEVYRETVRETVADGLVSLDELRLLEQLRERLGVSAQDHRRVLEELEDDQRALLESEGALSVERRVQLEGYQRVLEQALARGERPEALEDLRLEWGVDPADHARIAGALSGSTGPLERRAEALLDQIDAVRSALLGLSPMAPLAGFRFLIDVLLKRQDRLVDRVIDLLARFGDELAVHAAATDLFTPDKVARAEALEALEAATRAPARLLERLRAVVLDRMPKSERALPERGVRGVLTELLGSSNPWLRAGAIHGLAEIEADPEALAARLRAASVEGDPHPVVREALASALSGRDVSAPPAPPAGVPRTGRYARVPVPEASFARLTTLDRMLFLRCVPIFVDLEPGDLHALSDAAAERRFAPGEALCREGALTSDLFVLMTGTATVQVGTRSPVTVATLGPGDVVGELAVLDGSPRSATVLADTELRALALPAAPCRALMARRDVAPRVALTLTHRLRGALTQLREAP